MRVKARTVRRAGLCVVLGVVTSWLVAWGLVIAAWRGAWALPTTGGTTGAAVVGPHTVMATTNRAPGCTHEYWYAIRIDELDDEQFTEFGRLFRGIDGIAFHRGLSQSASHHQSEWDARQAESYPHSLAARFIGDALEGGVTVLEIGWPFSTVRQVTMSWPTALPVTGPHDPASFEIPWLKGNDPVWSWAPAASGPIRLPYRPNWPGLAINTAFYGGIFAIPLFGVPALRRTLRTRCGRCPACNYDLSATPEGPCPECGAVRSVPAG